MSEEATFDSIDRESEQLMFGPRGILLCGFDPDEQSTIVDFAQSFDRLPIIVAVDKDLSAIVGQLILRADRTGFKAESDLPRLALMSGLTQVELHQFMAQYRQSGLTRPLWATLTPTSATWPLSDLLRELDSERRAMEGDE